MLEARGDRDPRDRARECLYLLATPTAAADRAFDFLVTNVGDEVPVPDY